MKLFECIRVKGLAKGHIVVSLRGHDTGNLYLVLDVYNNRAKITDGKHHLWQNAKIKNVKHVKALTEIPQIKFESMNADADIVRRNAQLRLELKSIKAALTKIEITEE